jgi:MSHA biogenesis protein MshK
MATGLRMLLTTLVLCVPQIGQAESLPDPTRPPINLNGGDADAEHAVTAPRGLQTIIISPEHRAAIINGETVPLGGKFGDSTLVEVRENSVVLQNAHGRRVMELFPKAGIKKNDVAPNDNSHVQEDASGETNLPEKAVGGNK